MTQLRRASREKNPGVGKVLRDFLSELFSKVISPSSFVVVEFHVSRELKLEERSLEKVLEGDPSRVYDAMVSVLREEMLRHVDLMFSEYLREKLGISLEEEKVLGYLKEGDFGKLLRLAEGYFERVRSTR